MRFGYSWPLGHGRRMWVSMGPLGWLAFGWIVLPLFLAWCLLVAVVWLLLALGEAVTELYRWHRARRAPEWAKRARL